MPSFRLPLTLIAVFALAARAWSCSVPVFRYALEHWSGDAYHAFILKSGPLSADEEKLVAELKSANLSVSTADLAASPDAESLALWKRAGSPAGPTFVLKAPRFQAVAPAVWSGPLDADSITAALDSPARREIARRIGEGESAVWVLLESGDKTQDDAAEKVLRERLDYLGGVLALPKLDDQDIKNGLVSVPDDGLRLAFSIVRLSRAERAERAFVSMLLATEADLAGQTAPMVFPVFGQARVLYALVGKGINQETIDTAAHFLIGSCSCQVKEQNPGTDLLVTVDWKRLLKDQAIGAQDLPKASDIVSAMPETVTIKPHTSDEKPRSAACCPARAWIDEHRVLAVAIAAPALLLAAFGLARKFR